jgi:hypothetical protein
MKAKRDAVFAHDHAYGNLALFKSASCYILSVEFHFPSGSISDGPSKQD